MLSDVRRMERNVRELEHSIDAARAKVTGLRGIDYSHIGGGGGRHDGIGYDWCQHCWERFDGAAVAGDRLAEIERIEMTSNYGRHGRDWVFVDEG